MNILLLINSLSAGGAEVFVADLATALAERGHRVALFAYAGVLDKKGESLRQQLMRAGVDFISPEARSMAHKFLVPLILARVLRNLRPDIVHSNLDQSDCMSLFASILFGSRNETRFIRTVHSVYAIGRLPEIIHMWLRRFFDIQVACSKRVASAHPYLNTANTVIVENGIRMRKVCRGLASTSTLHTRFDIPCNSLTLINVGSFSHRNRQLPKAQDLMIDALAQLDRRDVHLILIGDGECRMALQKRARDRGIEKFIHFAGLCPDPTELVQEADIVIMPSRFEGLSLSCIEAACLGKPLIVSNIEAFSQFMGPSAVVVQPADIRSLTEGIVLALNNLSDLRHAAVELQPRFISTFDISRVVQDYLQVYEQSRVIKATKIQGFDLGPTHRGTL